MNDDGDREKAAKSECQRTIPQIEAAYDQVQAILLNEAQAEWGELIEIGSRLGWAGIVEWAEGNERRQLVLQFLLQMGAMRLWIVTIERKLEAEDAQKA